MWYTEPKSMVKLNGSLSHQFSLCRGVRQGSVLSPILFLLVMDPLLQQMESKNLGPSLAGQFMGASAHADDVRTVTSSLHCLEKQAGLVQTFAHQNGLSLNIQKCEVMIASSICKAEKVSVSIESMNIVAKKSLGFWWSWDLSAKVAIEEAIKKSKESLLHA